MQGVTWPVTQFQNLVDGKNKKNDFANTFLLLSQNLDFFGYVWPTDEK